MIDWTTISLKKFAGFISEELRKRGIETVLVGGACVTIYSKNRYQSYDLDYVTYEDMKKVRKALYDLGFKEKNRYFFREDCQWLVEFVSPPVAVGSESVQTFHILQTSLGSIKLLRAVDSVKDRLASYYHWSDKQSLEQAINICIEQDIDFDELEKWSKAEKQDEKFKIFKELLSSHNREI